MHVRRRIVLTLLAAHKKTFLEERMNIIRPPYRAMVISIWLVAFIIPAVTLAGAPKLQYTDSNSGPVPIPPAVRDIQTIVAEPYFKVSDQGLQLEGPAYDTEGNLYFVEVFGGRVFTLTPDKKLTTVLGKNDLSPAGLAIHDNGRIFIAGLGNFKDSGSVVSIGPTGEGMKTVVSPDKGYLPDDLVFDTTGGFYYTDFKGTSTQPQGGVYYVSPDFDNIVPVLPNLSIANGIALGPDGKTLWVTEFGAGLLHRVFLKDPTTIAPFGATVVYHFTGASPDSLRTDADGNVYVAMYGQGRILVLNKMGVPIGQILIPGREEGHNLRTTSMAFKPGTNELFILTNDGQGGKGSWIFHARGFAEGTQLYSHASGGPD